MTAEPSSRVEQPVPLVDLSRLDEDILAAAESTFSRLARSGAFTFGEELEAFESEFAGYCGSRDCVGVSDGTNALRIALEALGVGANDEVITVPNTFIATVEAIASTGARPVLVDVDPETRCMDPGRLAEAIGPRTAAVIPVHLYGRPAPMVEILEVCGDIPIVEDAAQAHGARIGESRAGSLGVAGCFSFYPTKNLGAMGDAGAVVCEDAALAAKMRSLRHHGADLGSANRHLRLGSTARLDNVQAAILRLKLGRLDSWNDERRAAAERYRRLLRGLPVILPRPDPQDGRQVFHLFVIEVDERDGVLAELRERGIGTAVHYPTPVHLQPGWRWLGYEPGDFPASEALAHRALSLPIFPGITPEEIERVADVITSAVTVRG